MPEDEEVAKMSVDFLILADGAQVTGGKLYILGGGWDRVQLSEYPGAFPLGVAVGVRVPWTETNRRHTFVVRGTTADGDKEFFRGEGEFEVGRPPGIPRGMSQLFQMALQLPLQVPGPGHYEVEVVIDEGKARRAAPYYAVKLPP